MADAKPSVLVQLDTDSQPSVFDAIVAADCGVDHLLRHGGVHAETVRELVFGTIFTRAPGDLNRTAIFIGGSDVSAGESLLKEVLRTFIGPMRVSVMLDSSGANTTAAAAVLTAAAHLELDKTTALVLGATGPVGQRVVRLLALQGASVRVGSRRLDRAEAVCDLVRTKVPSADLSAWATPLAQDTAEASAAVQLVVAAGAPGVELMPAAVRRRLSPLRVAIDLNAVAPAGLEGIDPQDRAKNREGVISYGDLGVGGTKMKIHKAAIRRLFESSGQVLDAEEIYAIGRSL